MGSNLERIEERERVIFAEYQTINPRNRKISKQIYEQSSLEFQLHDSQTVGIIYL